LVSFEELLSIVLLHICDYLDHDHTSSLVSFARASKHCYSTAINLLFGTIKLSTGSHLAGQAQQWHDTLQRNAATGYVRCLIIDGHWPLDKNGISHQHCLKLSAEDRGYERRLVDKLPWFHNNADDQFATFVYEVNDFWKPVAALVKQLPELQDLIYRCHMQFQPCLLETLHQSLPHCRLHIDPFKLRSLNDFSTDPYECVHATSPCLYRIGVNCDMHGSITAKLQTLNYEAVQSMVAGLAPNLGKFVYSMPITVLLYGRSRMVSLGRDLP
jgi:hypothetical protein